jgi:hypothetical protein
VQVRNPTPLQSLLREVDQILIGDLEFIAKCDELLRKCQLIALAATERLQTVVGGDFQASSNPTVAGSAAAVRFSRSLPDS